MKVMYKFIFDPMNTINIQIPNNNIHIVNQTFDDNIAFSTPIPHKELLTLPQNLLLPYKST